MIVVLNGGDLASSESARSLYWAAEYKGIQADRVFGRVRRQALLRRLARFLGLAAPEPMDEAAMDAAWDGVGRAGRAMVGIDAVVGAVDPVTGTFDPLPALKLRWKAAWRRLWTVEDLDALPALPVVRGVDGWYLTDVPRSVLTLEILRAKGARAAVVVRSEAHGQESAYAEIELGAPSYSLVECERSYDCCEHEESRAV